MLVNDIFKAGIRMTTVQNMAYLYASSSPHPHPHPKSQKCQRV